MRRVIAVAALAYGWLLLAQPAVAQNDWQFPDPYFGAIEFDVSRAPAARPRQVAPTPPAARPKAARPRPHRQRVRWLQSGARP